MMIREGKVFRFVIQPAISATETSDRKLALTELTQKWSDAIATYIKRYPQQWVWMHERWKTQPKESHDNQQTANESRKGAMPKDRSASRFVLTVLVGVMSGMFYTGSLKSNPVISTPVIAEAVEANSSIDGADEMDGFSLAEHVDGVKQWELNGDNATIEGNLVTVFQPDGVGYNKDRTVYLTASLALIDQATRRMRLEHNVTIHTSDGIWIFTPILYWDSREDTFFTDSPVRMETDNLLLLGRGASGKMNAKHITLNRDVELIFSPEADQTQENQEPPEKHVIITCDGSLTFDYKRFIATFEDNVHVDDPSGDLYSDKLVAYLDQVTHAIRFADATGNVRIQQANNVALSDRAVYQPGLGKMSLAGGRPTLVITPSDRPKASRIPLRGFTTIGTTKTP